MGGSDVRAALVGAGLVGQVAHLATLTAPGSPIRLAGVVDASAGRARTLGEKHGVPFATTLDALAADLAAEHADALDAVVVAAPDPFHLDLVLRSLDLGLHVFVEKPLGLTPSECRRMALAAERAGTVCQVGYMKRFDVAVRVFLDDLEQRGAHVTGIGVEVRDPDAAPFVVGFPFVPDGGDVPAALLDEGSRRFAAAVDSVLGRPATPGELTAYGSFTSSLVHDLNLARLLVGRPVTVECGFVAMDGAQVGMHLRTEDGAILRLTHTQVPTIADYEERFTIYTSKGLYEMVFPAPYLLGEPTVLRRIEVKDEQERSEVAVLDTSGEEAFVRELRSFARAVRSGRGQPFENGLADAGEDLRLIGDALRLAARTS